MQFFLHRSYLLALTFCTSSKWLLTFTYRKPFIQFSLGITFTFTNETGSNCLKWNDNSQESQPQGIKSIFEGKVFLKRSMLRPKLQIILLNTWDFLVIIHYGEIDKTLLFFGPEGNAVCQGKEKKKKNTFFSFIFTSLVRFDFRWYQKAKVLCQTPMWA